VTLFKAFAFAICLYFVRALFILDIFNNIFQMYLKEPFFIEIICKVRK
jgi:hypothetical protein